MRIGNFIIKYNKLSNEEDRNELLSSHLELFGIQSGQIDFGKKFLQYYLKNKNIKKFLQDCGFENFSFERYEKYLEHLINKKGTADKNFFKLKYGDILGEEKRNEKINNIKSIYDFDFVKQKNPNLSRKEIENIIKERKEKTSGSKERYIKKFGFEIGNQKYKNFCKKTGYRNTKKGLISLYGEKEGIIKYFEKNKKNSLSSELNGYCLKYGTTKGKKLYDKINKKRSKGNTKNEIIKKFGITHFNRISHRKKLSANSKGLKTLGFSENEIKTILKNRKIYFENPMKYLIGKGYSEEDAKIKIYHYSSGNKDLSKEELKFLFEKSEIIKKIKKERYQASNESLKIFLPLKNRILNNSILIDEDIKIGFGNTKELILKNDKGKKFFYDFSIKKMKIIIEFDSRYRHPPENLTDEELLLWKNGCGQNGIEVKNKDLYKTEIAKNFGYKIFRITSNKKENYNFIINILKNEDKNYNFFKREDTNLGLGS